MRTIADELKARFAACRYLEKLKRNKKLAREVMKTNAVARNPAGYLEVLSKAATTKKSRPEL